MNNKILTGCFIAAVSPSIFSETISGELNILVFDNFEKKQTTTVYQLNDNDQYYTLELPDSVKKDKLSTGQKITVEGDIENSAPDESAGTTTQSSLENGSLESPLLKNVKKEKKIKVKSFKLDTSSKDKTTDNASLQNAMSSPMLASASIEDPKNRKIVTLLLDFSDKKTSSSLNTSTLYANMYTTPTSMKVDYERSSFNQVSFNPDPNKNGAPDIFTVKLNYPIGTSCDFRKWTTDAEAAAKTMGVDLALYQHKMIIFPETAGCAWNGLGEVGCANNNCHTWIRAYANVTTYVRGIYVHEIGHNLGMRHAGIDANNDGVTESNYGDESCFMGGNHAAIKEANAPHREQMNWFAAFPGSLKNVTQNGLFSLSPLEGGASGKLVVIKVPKPDTSDFYYLSYRTNIGPFGIGATNYLNKVNIHTVPSTGANAGATYFLQALGVGNTFLDEKNKLSIKVLSLDGTKANVQVTFIGTESPTGKLSTVKIYNNDNSKAVGYTDWDVNYWKGNCPPYSEPVGLSAARYLNRANTVACLIKDSTTSTARGEYVYALGGVSASQRGAHRMGDWDYGYYKWECGLDQYVSGFSQNKTSFQLHKIRCARGTFTNGGQNSCEVRLVGYGKNDLGSTLGGDWDPNYYKAQCSDGKLIYGVSVDTKNYMPHKILCCDK